MDKQRTCSVCGRPLYFSCREEAKPGFEVLTYECKHCRNVEQFIAEVPERRQS